MMNCLLIHRMVSDFFPVALSCIVLYYNHLRHKKTSSLCSKCPEVENSAVVSWMCIWYFPKWHRKENIKEHTVLCHLNCWVISGGRTQWLELRSCKLNPQCGGWPAEWPSGTPWFFLYIFPFDKTRMMWPQRGTVRLKSYFLKELGDPLRKGMYRCGYLPLHNFNILKRVSIARSVSLDAYRCSKITNTFP